MYIISIDNKTVTKVYGTEIAYSAWRKACEFAVLIGATCNLIDTNTGEIVASTKDD